MILLDQKHPTMPPLGVASGVTQQSNYVMSLIVVA